MCIVLAREAREGPNTQVQAGRFMAETGHHLEDVMANCHPPWYCWKGDWQDHSTPRGSFSTPLEAGEESHRRDLSSMFMTVGDTDTFWHPQFSVPKSFHLQRKELSYLPSAGRVPFFLVVYDFYLQHWIRFHVVRTETCRTLLCRVHRYLLDAFIVCLMGHTAVQTSVAQVFWQRRPHFSAC